MTELRLWLPSYLGPSPNRLLGVHWSLVRRERVKARTALLCALSDLPETFSIPTTWSQAQSSSSIGSLKAALYRAMGQKISTSRSPKSKLRRAKRSVRQSELFTL
jgi:hypothetical protein